MNVSEYILNFLVKKKVKKVFLLTGGAVSFLVDAFSKNKKISYVSVAHEQAAAMMADAYSRLGPNFGCTMVTSGPGATNLLTGIACSYFDSIPNIHICGQVNTYEQQDSHASLKKVRQVGFQETNIVDMAKPITKFAYKLKNANEIKYILEKSYHIATTGRPGPVLLDVPMDIQKKVLKTNNLKGFSPKKKEKNIKLNLVKRIYKGIKDAKRPILILGGGVKYSKSFDKVISLINKIKIPVVTTWSGVDLINHNNKKYIGNIGVYGSRAANFAVQNADLIFCLGSRLDTRVTGGVPKNFARGAKKIVVDIDQHELNKKRGLVIDIKVNQDIKKFLEKFIPYKINIREKSEWLQTCKNWKKKFPIILKSYYENKKFVDPYVFFERLSNKTKKNEIIIADDGAHLTWALQAIKVKPPQILFSAFGNSPMGYALPASIGASLVKKNSRVLCIDGDGSIQINLQELHTIEKLKLPIKIFIMNNNGYGIIKQFQSLYLGSRHEASGKGVSNPDFKKISNAFNIKYTKIKNNLELFKIANVLKSNKPEIIDVIINPNQKILPKLQFGNPLEDMTPNLKFSELKKNMIIPMLLNKIKLTEIN